MNFPHPLRSLAQIPDLEGLLDVCKHFDIEITAFGSLVRRLAWHLVHMDKVPSLYELAPFLSDIDISHTGPAEKTLEIRRAILASVPFSECFRWEIFSEEDLKAFADDETHLPVIPVNKLRLATRDARGIDDPFEGYWDLLNNEYRLLRSAFYHRSVLRRNHRDCELLYAMNYLRVLLEEQPPKFKGQPGMDVANSIAADAQTSSLLASLEESAYLRAKFWYRSQILRASCPDQESWDFVMNETNVGEALAFINDSLRANVVDLGSKGEYGAGGTMATSCRLIGNRFRLDFPMVEPALQEGAEAMWNECTSQRAGLEELIKHPFPKLPEGQRIVADTPEFRFHTGSPSCTPDDEHLHFQIPLSRTCENTCMKHGETRLAAFVLLTAEVWGERKAPPTLMSFALPTPAACWLKPWSSRSATTLRLQLRLNCGRFLSMFPQLVWQGFPDHVDCYRLKFFIVAKS